MDSVSKSYGNVRALDKVSFTVYSGQIYGYLGPNGAGKTTTIKILLDLIKRDEGVVEVFGLDPAVDRGEVLARVGYTPEIPSLPKFMSGFEFLVFTGLISGLDKQLARERARYYIDLIGLSKDANRKIGKYSKGMIQKLSLASALISSPELLILDEPTLGMDPVSRAQVRDLLIEANKNGATIFLSSHLLGEVEKICSHVVLINKGRILYSGSLDDMLSKTESTIIEVLLDKVTPEILNELSKLEFIDRVETLHNTVKITISKRGDYRAEIFKAISRCGGVILEMKSRRVSLEEAFLKMVSEEG